MSSSELHYIVDGMSCGGCKRSVVEEVSEVAGVAAVEVVLETGGVTVRGDELDDQAIQSAIKLAGYAPRPIDA